MKNRKNTFCPDAIMGDINEASARYGVGKASVRKLATDCGAIVRVGRLVRFNFSILDGYVAEISGK